MDRVRWGSLGSSRFLAARALPEVSRGSHAHLLGVASRSLERAQELAHKLGVPRAYGSYEELLADPDIEVVYVTLPNSLHAEWSLRALEAGKHVLCEKPLMPTGDQARELLRKASVFDTFLFEGHMWRYHPQWREVRKMLDEGAVGQPGLVRMHYSYFNRDPESARNDPARGGGALNMIGCYPAAMGNFIFADQQARRVLASIDIDPELGVDRLVSCIVEYDHGHLEFSVSQQLSDEQTLVINGTEAYLRMDLPVTPNVTDIVQLLLGMEDSSRTIEVPAASQFALQADAVSEAVRAGHRPDLSKGLRAIDIVDAVRESAQGGGWATIRSGG